MSTTKSPQDLLREQFLACSKLIEHLCKLMSQRIRSIEKVLNDPSTPEPVRARSEETMIAMLRALVDAAHKSASFLLVKGSGSAEAPTAPTHEDILAELVGKTK